MGVLNIFKKQQVYIISIKNIENTCLELQRGQVSLVNTNKKMVENNKCLGVIKQKN